MRKEQDEDSAFESEDMFGFVQELEEDGIEMHDRKSLTSSGNNTNAGVNNARF